MKIKDLPPYKPVTLLFTNLYGAEPRALPIPGDLPVAGVKPPQYAGDCTTYMLSDGTVWTYLGISAYKADNDERVNGWYCIFHN